MAFKVFRITAGLTLLVFPATASAAGITYDCDTAADHFSELVLPSSSLPFTVSGSVQLNTVAASTTYTPVARVQIASSAPPGKPPGIYAGFSLTVVPVGAKKLPSGETAIQILDYNSTGKNDEAVPLSILTKPGTVQPFALSYDGNKVTVKLGSETKSFLMKAAEPAVRIVCSTGEFLFTDLIIKPQR